MNIPFETQEAIKAHAIATFPNECCGLIIDDKFVPTENVSLSPTETFTIQKDVFAAAMISGKLQAVIHSHCITPAHTSRFDPRQPSGADMKSWLATNIPWGIVATNGTEASEILWMDDSVIAPLHGRDFIHGVHDCYAIIRDYFRTELNILLPNYARGMEWWDKGEDLYSQNFKEAGFYEISEAEADVNDCCLFQVKSPVINHAAVITGQDEILHHLFHRLSGPDRLDKWRKSIVKYVRYDAALNTQIQGNLDATANPTARSVSR